MCTFQPSAMPALGIETGGSLACRILGFVCLICRFGSRGRPGLFGARGGKRSRPEREPNSDGGRTAGCLAVRGRPVVWSPPSFLCP